MLSHGFFIYIGVTIASVAPVAGQIAQIDKHIEIAAA
jgi:hypothetical protein